MSDGRTYSRAFAGGEVTPEFFGRLDDSKFQLGLAKCRNFIVKPHGPLANRGGLRFVRKAKVPTQRARVLPFVYSSSQAVVIELHDTCFRFIVDGANLLAGTPTAWSGATAYAIGDMALSGGTVYYCTVAHTNQAPPDTDYWYALPSTLYEIPHPYLEADLAGIKFVQSNDVLTLTHPLYPPAELRRYGATRWTYSVISFAPTVSAPTNAAATATPAVSMPGTPTLQSYVVTAVKGVSESSASTTSVSDSASITAITKANPGVLSITAPALAAGSFTVGDAVFISGVNGMSELNDNFYEIHSYTFTAAVTESFYEEGVGLITYEVSPASALIELEPAGGGTPVDTTSFTTYVGGGTIAKQGAARCSNNLFDDGAYNTISWDAVATADRYNVYKLSGGLYGYIGQTEGLSFTDDNIAADLSRTPPIFDSLFASAGNYPATVGYVDQRRCFAGTINDPAYFWGTRAGTESDLSYSIPQSDNDRIAFRVASRQRSEIKHIVSMNFLVLLSESVEWRVAPANGEVLTPDVSVKPQSAVGSGDAQPALVNNNLVFAAARGGHLRELAFSQQAGGYLTGDLSLRAPHLFDGSTIVEMAYAKAPIPIVWAVSSSGLLIGLTYIPEEQVGAFHWHDTQDGLFESVCVVPEGDTDVLYAVVNRSGERYIERMEPRQSTDGALGFFVDSGLSYSGAPATTFSGLDHLEGQTVTINGDGAVFPNQVVSGGAVTISEPVSECSIGLPITAEAQTLPLTLQTEGYGTGRPKNINEVWIRVYRARGIFAGPSFEKMTEHKPRNAEPYGSPPALITDEIKITLPPSWTSDGQICMRHNDPLPMTILSLSPGFAVGG